MLNIKKWAVAVVILSLFIISLLWAPVSYGSDGDRAFVCHGVINNIRLIHRLRLMGDITYGYVGTGEDPVRFSRSPTQVFQTLCYGSDEEFERMAVEYMKAVLDAAEKGLVVIDPNAFVNNPIFSKYGLYRDYDLVSMSYRLPEPEKTDISPDGLSYYSEYVTLYAPLRLGGIRFKARFSARLGSAPGSVDRVSVSTSLVGQWGLGSWTDSDTYVPCGDPCSSEPSEGTWVKIYTGSDAVCGLSSVSGNGSFAVLQVHHLVEWHATPTYIIGGTITLARKPLVKVSFQPVSSSYGYWRLIRITHMADEGWCN